MSAIGCSVSTFGLARFRRNAATISPKAIMTATKTERKDIPRLHSTPSSRTNHSGQSFYAVLTRSRSLTFGEGDSNGSDGKRLEVAWSRGGRGRGQALAQESLTVSAPPYLGVPSSSPAYQSSPPRNFCVPSPRGKSSPKSEHDYAGLHGSTRKPKEPRY